jgi:hypothetical protein
VQAWWLSSICARMCGGTRLAASRAQRPSSGMRHYLVAVADASSEPALWALLDIEAVRHEASVCKFARNSDPLRGGFRVQ